MNRNTLLAHVHMAVKALGMTDEQYRSLLDHRYGVTSSATLDLPTLRDLVRHFEKLGWAAPRKTTPRAAIHPLCKRVWAQCYSLARPVPAYADGIAWQMFGVEKLTWCDPTQIRAVSVALTKQQIKAGADQA